MDQIFTTERRKRVPCIWAKHLLQALGNLPPHKGGKSNLCQEMVTVLCYKPLVGKRLESIGVWPQGEGLFILHIQYNSTMQNPLLFSTVWH